MIDPSTYQQPVSLLSSQTQEESGAVRKKVFRMGRNDRMAGSVPIWEGRSHALEKLENDLSLAARGVNKGQPQGLSYADSDIQNSRYVQQPEEEFGFYDLLDMINPLQHIPLVSNVYRSVTGDDIKPASQIIGGAVFGGVLGAASGLVNVIIKEETGKDVSENVLALVGGDKKSAFSMVQQQEIMPEQRLDKIAKNPDISPENELSPALLGFTNLNAPLERDSARYKMAPAAQGRTAGHIKKPDYAAQQSQEKISTAGFYALSPRQSITQVRFSDLPREDL